MNNFKKKEIYLCSFSSPGLEKSKLRFLRQAKEIKKYKKIKIYGYDDLDSYTKKKINHYINQNDLKGYGYYCWKPFIIHKFLKKVPKNSIVQYLDIGFHINPNGIKILEQYIDLCKKKNFINFMYKKLKNNSLKNLKQQLLFENEYSKRDLWEKLNLTPASDIMKSGQIISGIFFFMNNYKSKKIIKNWLDLSKNMNLMDDTSSKSKELKSFIEHRHDQSVFSLLCKKFKTHSLSASEVEFCKKDGKNTWEHLKNNPFLAKRDKSYNLKDKSIIILKKVLKKCFYD